MSADSGGTPLSHARFLTVDGRLLNFEFPFNPTTLKLTRSVTWSEQSPAFQPWPTLQYGHGGADKLDFDMLLDESESGRSILGQVRKLYKLTMPGLLGLSVRPPSVLFIWESFLFHGVVNNLTFDMNLFDSTGAPKRADVTVGLTGKAFLDVRAPLALFDQAFNFI